MTNVGVWGYLIFVSERENDCKVAHKEASSPPPPFLGAPLIVRPVVFEH